MIISKKFAYNQIIGVVLYLLQFFQFVNIATTFIVFLLIIYFYKKNKLEYSLSLILLFSALSVNGVNIYVLQIAGVNLFYITILVLFFIYLFKNIDRILWIPRFLAIYIGLIVVVLSYSLPNLIDSTLYFIKDLIIILIIPLTIVILFKNLENEKILHLFFNIISIKILASLIMFMTGLTLSQDENMFNALTIDNADELDSLFVVFLLAMLFTRKSREGRWLIVLLLISLFGLLNYGLGFVGLGSQVMIMVIIVICFFGLRRLSLFIPLLVLLIVSINNVGSESIDYKFQNITQLISNLDRDSVYMIPHSPQVRVIELINIFSYPWYNVLFGHGVGGYFSDYYFQFNENIGKFDFSEFEIRSRRFYNPHNLAYNFLKFGILWQIFLLLLVYKALKRTSGNTRVFVVISLFTLSLNMGYATKTSILFGIILIMVSKGSCRQSSEEKN